MKKKIISCLLVLLVITMTVLAEENHKKYVGEGVKLKGETEWTSPSSFSSSPFIKDTTKPSVKKEVSRDKRTENINTIIEIAEKYHKTHTYSKYYQSVCIDMSLDIWGMIEKRGINAIIMIGNLDYPTAPLYKANHAWVLAEVGPSDWLAIETTGGYVVSHDENSAYYKGFTFDGYAKYKEYDDLTKEYNNQLKRIKELGTSWPFYNSEVKKLEDIAKQIESLLH